MRAKVLTVVGARPNFMKAAPIHQAFEAAGHRHQIIHTGQHYDSAMSKVFFDDLGLPEPAQFLGVGSGTHGVQTAACLVALEKVFENERPDMVLVVGDVNSTVSGALAASKLGIPVGHVEAGLRSRDWGMPEEVNRAVVDVLADILLTPSPDADENLMAEGRNPARIRCVGNVMIDSLLQHRDRAVRHDPFQAFGQAPAPGRFAVLTLHRPSNVDDPAVLNRIMRAVEESANALPVVFPVHPRTRNKLHSLGRQLCPRLLLTKPLGYLDFLALYSRATFVMTDSGGIQEETTALGIPCLTIRENTERPITIAQGTNVLVGTDPGRICAEAKAILETGGKKGRVPKLWDGKTSERIVQSVVDFLGSDHAHWPR